MTNNKMIWIFEQHLNKPVTVGVKHIFEHTKLFYYNGILKAISENGGLIIEDYHGVIHQVFINEVIDFKTDERRGE